MPTIIITTDLTTADTIAIELGWNDLRDCQRQTHLVKNIDMDKEEVTFDFSCEDMGTIGTILANLK